MDTPSFAALAPWLGIGLVFVLAGGVKGITGMGLPTVAMSLLGLWMAPAQAAALLVMPSLVTNVAQCQGPAWRKLIATLWPVWLGMIATTVWSPDLSTLAPIDARLALGAILVVYGLWGLWKPVVPQVSRGAWGIGLAAGLATGFVTASTAVFVLPLVPYLQALRLDKDTMIQALGLSFTVATLALATRLHAFEGGTLLSVPAFVALAAAVGGLVLGAAVRARISAATFQRALFLVFIALGAANLWRAL
ncbi:sulfite exporter TauE/SafE family protein [Mitsuaria sp. GD03876]|uniref:sulfite exporter TauE/SafE family protein n=1 Tax=Mitsuaria sp. GD03876 TaxID=2975399 RepID=UPI0024488F3E|nr:sulfite exporter TauE/SafE family protein [Mitsuaria sp. GD03876]MDH0867084.1 sulfite exporter TauE/SafE family protein [Mitsuaria sp. GD03876]